MLFKNYNYSSSFCWLKKAKNILNIIFFQTLFSVKIVVVVVNRSVLNIHHSPEATPRDCDDFALRHLSTRESGEVNRIEMSLEMVDLGDSLTVIVLIEVNREQFIPENALEVLKHVVLWAVLFVMMPSSLPTLRSIITLTLARKRTLLSHHAVVSRARLLASGRCWMALHHH